MKDWTMSQKLPVNNFKWIKDTYQFNEDFIKNYNEEINKGYFLEVDVQYLEKLHELYDNLAFIPGRMKIEKVEKLIYRIKLNVIHIRNLKQSLNHGLDFKKVHRVINLIKMVG